MSTAAQQLSEWIEITHPDFFNVLYRYVANRRVGMALNGARLRGFGDDGDTLDYFTPDVSADVDPDTTDAIASSYTPATVDIPTLTASDLGVSSAVDTPLVPVSTDATLPVSTDSAGSSSFLSTVGSGIASAASSVGNFLTSAQGLSDVTKLATAYFQLQTTNTNAAIQKQVLTAQIARASVGQSPAPLTYAVASNGQLVPIYAVSTGSPLPVALQNALATGASQYVTTPSGVSGYTVPSNIVGGLTDGPSLTDVLPWIALVLGGLILANELGK